MIELIPAIDIIDGKCVRLTRGEYSSKKSYDVAPLDVAKRIEGLGYKRLHVVDLDGAKSKRVVNIRVLKDIAQSTNLKIDFGGGVKSDDDIQAVFDNGASLVTVGSVAVTQPELLDKWIAAYGAGKIILGADVSDGKICINGWKEKSETLLMPFIERYYNAGVRKVLCTDISRDGMLQGASVSLYKQVMSKFPSLHLIASGGVSSESDIDDLDKAGVPAVVFGKAIYEGRVDLCALAQKYLNQQIQES
jgi:phosphoribosylformimino-5-aminoimidazole carboxamide ribotide isomerase